MIGLTSMTVEEFTASLTAYVRQIVNDRATPGDWEKDFGDKVKELVEKFQFNHRTASFVLGDEDISISVDAEVQTGDLPPSDKSHQQQQCDGMSESEHRVWQRLKLGNLKPRELEREFDQRQPAEAVKSVRLRRQFIKECMHIDVAGLPYDHYDYSLVYGACCENVFGYVPLPTGIVGPLRINGCDVYVPMSTTEGALVASANRGCKALNMCGGVEVSVEKDGMTRAPVLKFADTAELRLCVEWLSKDDIFNMIRHTFESESRFAKLQCYELYIDESYLFVRFVATTGDAMGMNMVTKCCYKALNVITDEFKSAKVISISGNMCVDKKASLINWERGRGKSVIASATISAAVIKSIFRVNVDDLVALGHAKFELGAQHAGCIGGGNAHAANVVAAIFLATGQDAAQVVSSSMCSTVLTKTDAGDLKMTCRMPCLEVGTIGGGTILPAQKTCLKMMGCCGGHLTEPGENAKRLARIICSTVLAGELSLLASQCAGDLMTGHIKLNRSSINLTSSPSLRQISHLSETPSHFSSEINLVTATPRRSNSLVCASTTNRRSDGLPPAAQRITVVDVSPVPSSPGSESQRKSKAPVIVVATKLSKKVAARCDHLL